MAGVVDFGVGSGFCGGVFLSRLCFVSVSGEGIEGSSGGFLRIDLWVISRGKRESFDVRAVYADGFTGCFSWMGSDSDGITLAWGVLACDSQWVTLLADSFFPEGACPMVWGGQRALSSDMDCGESSVGGVGCIADFLFHSEAF